MLVFFIFMPLGALIGAVVGALRFRLIARDTQVLVEKEPARQRNG